MQIILLHHHVTLSGVPSDPQFSKFNGTCDQPQRFVRSHGSVFS